ncbi:MAG: hypothetical protein ACP5JT_02800 [Thermoplasmata archaeon]|jgi:precorrin-6B methylase 2
MKFVDLIGMDVIIKLKDESSLIANVIDFDNEEKAMHIMVYENYANKKFKDYKIIKLKDIIEINPM